MMELKLELLLLLFIYFYVRQNERIKESNQRLWTLGMCSESYVT